MDRWEFESLTEVRRFIGSASGTGRERVGSLPKGFRKFAGRFVGSSRSLPRKIESLPKKLGGTRQNHRGVRELAGSPQDGFRGIVGRPSEVRRKLDGRRLDLRTL
ncbi:unnamed protein product [Musa textilis]